MQIRHIRNAGGWPKGSVFYSLMLLTRIMNQWLLHDTIAHILTEDCAIQKLLDNRSRVLGEYVVVALTSVVL